MKITSTKKCLIKFKVACRMYRFDRIYIPLLMSFFILSSNEAKEFVVDTTANNSITFFAGSTFGSFEGVTSTIRGSLFWDNGDTLSAGSVHFEVPLQTIDTGIGLRNKHMRNKYLETDQYPLAVYEGSLTAWEDSDGDTARVKSNGTLKIHGVEKEMPATATLENTDSGFRVTTAFKLNIADFNIEQPSFLLTKMDKEVQLKLTFFLVN